MNLLQADSKVTRVGVDGHCDLDIKRCTQMFGDFTPNISFHFNRSFWKHIYSMYSYSIVIFVMSKPGVV